MLRSRRLMLASAAMGSDAWTPADIDGLVLWLDASRAPGTDGDAVDIWRDSSKEHNDASQATADYMPTLQTAEVNGRHAVRFDGSNDLLAFGDDDSLDLISEFAMIAVCKSTSVSGFARAISKAGAWSLGRDSSKIIFTAPTVKDFRTTDNWLNADVWSIVGIEMDAVFDVTFSINGATKETVAHTAGCKVSTSGGYVGVGVTGNSEFWSGDIAMLLIYNRLLSDTDKTALYSYLSTHFGIYVPVVDADAASASHPEGPLTIPTYDESGEAVHPDVVDFGAGVTWNGYRYWMAMTPYPGSDGSYENPSIIASNNGDTWVVPDGIINPIVAAPGDGYANSDTDMHYNSAEDRLYCIFRKYKVGSEILYYTSSADGVTWSAPVEMLTSSATAELTSPAIVLAGGEYQMWVSNQTQLIYRTAPALTGPWSSPTVCTLHVSYGTPPVVYHHDVIKHGDVYYGIFSTASHEYFATSRDGIEWQIDRNITLAGQIGEWYQYVYRGTIAYNGTAFDHWYSVNDGGTPRVWAIARTTITGISPL